MYAPPGSAFHSSSEQEAVLCVAYVACVACVACVAVLRNSRYTIQIEWSLPDATSKLRFTIPKSMLQ